MVDCKDCISEEDEKRFYQEIEKNIKNKFDRIIGNTAKEICDVFNTDELDTILTLEEFHKLEEQGVFHPDVEYQDTKNSVCKEIANRMNIIGKK